MNFLLVADTHFTDNQIEEYRWCVFDHLIEVSLQNNVNHIYIMGDFVDRKDRHSGRLVNRLVENLCLVKEKTKAIISILAGNHDSPIEGVHYWEFLNKYEGIHYITQPEFHYNQILVLPFSPNPIRDWSDLPLKEAKAILMHQPVQGVFVDEYRKLEEAPVLPPMPNVPTFSGDIHRPQVFGSIIYLGTPYPVHFNENWKHRIILVKDFQFRKYQEITLPSIRRSIVEVSSTNELITNDGFKQGDQIRIRVKLDGKNLSSWPVEQQQILDWAKEKGVYVASVEAVLSGGAVENKEEVAPQITNPEDVVRQYAIQEKLSDDVVEMGLSFLKE